MVSLFTNIYFTTLIFTSSKFTQEKPVWLSPKRLWRTIQNVSCLRQKLKDCCKNLDMSTPQLAQIILSMTTNRAMIRWAYFHDEWPLIFSPVQLNLQSRLSNTRQIDFVSRGPRADMDDDNADSVSVSEYRESNTMVSTSYVILNVAEV